MRTVMTKDDFYAWFKAEHVALHTEWTKDVGTPNYNKKYWIRREQSFHAEAQTLATRLGIEPPYLRF